MLKEKFRTKKVFRQNNKDCNKLKNLAYIHTMEFTCSVCENKFPLEEKHKKSAKCPKCFKEMKNKCAKAYKEKINKMTKIICNNCHISKPGTEYPGNGKHCKTCKNEKTKQNYEKIKEEVKNKVIEKQNEKDCSVCKETKLIDEFFESKCKGTIRASCKTCTLKARHENYQNNREARIKQTSQYKTERKKVDLAFKFERNIRSRLYHAFKKSSVLKRQRTMEYVGCTPIFFKEWMEFQFNSYMTLENHGSYWDIDHVKPCASFDLNDENEAGICFHWSNCRPLSSVENRRKSDKYNEWDTILQDIKANYFKKLYDGQKSSPPHT